MIRKVGLILIFSGIILSVVINFINSTVYAQNTFGEIKTSFGLNEIPGLDCGIASDKSRSKCCSSESYKKLQRQIKKDASLPGLLDTAFRKAGVLGKINKFKKILDVIQNMDKGIDPPKCFLGEPDDPNNPNCTCLTAGEMVSKPVAVSKVLELCQKYVGKSGNREINKCTECFTKGGYFSAIGCLYFQPDRFILFNVFGLGLKLGGLFAFLCIIYSAIEIQISQGNKEKISKARERIIACILGLLVVIFSVFILKLIGINILGIPWLG